MVPGSHTVQRIDPASNAVIAAISLDDQQTSAGNPVHGVFGAGALWVVDELAGRVYRIDPSTNQAGALDLSLETFDGAGLGDFFITYGRGLVWVRSAENRIVAIDPATLQVAQTYETPQGSGGAFFVAPDSLWMANSSAGNVWGKQLP